MNELPIIAVFVSGNGTNLQSIIDHIQSGKLKAKIGLVISDQESAYALERCKKANVSSIVVRRKDFKTKEYFEKAMMDALEKSKVEWIVLAGFMRILSSFFVKNYKSRILNIHPSLLPKYPGLNSIEKAWNAKDSHTGVTIHYVDEGVDTGPIIAQEKIAIDPTDTLELLTQKVHAVEHQLYPKAIQKVLWQKKT